MLTSGERWGNDEGCGVSRAERYTAHRVERAREWFVQRDHTRARQSAHMSHDTSIKFVTRKRTRTPSLVARPSELHCIEPRRASAAICGLCEKSHRVRSHEDPDGRWRCPMPEAEPRDRRTQIRHPRPRTPKRDIHFQFHIRYIEKEWAPLDARRSLCKLRNMLHGALPRPTPLSLCPTRYTRRAARHPDRRWPPRDPPLRYASSLERRARGKFTTISVSFSRARGPHLSNVAF